MYVCMSVCMRLINVICRCLTMIYSQYYLLLTKSRLLQSSSLVLICQVATANNPTLPQTRPQYATHRLQFSRSQRPSQAPIQQVLATIREQQSIIINELMFMVRACNFFTQLPAGDNSHMKETNTDFKLKKTRSKVIAEGLD